MRRRTTAEMDELVRDAGFEKIEMEIDRMGNVHRLDRAARRLARANALATDVRQSRSRSRPACPLLFLVVYGGCNWITAQRSDVGTLYFEWERHIPFVPLMIVPYLSIDLFFVAAPFLCRSRRELSTFAKRESLRPLSRREFASCFFRSGSRFERPHASGWLGAIFDWFRGMDAPYNLFPSLHIALGLCSS